MMATAAPPKSPATATNRRKQIATEMPVAIGWPSEGGDRNYYPQTSHPAGYDTDNDGMADDWEVANGLIVGTQDHNQDLDGDGYTNIEELVYSLLRCGG